MTRGLGTAALEHGFTIQSQVRINYYSLTQLGKNAFILNKYLEIALSY